MTTKTVSIRIDTDSAEWTVRDAVGKILASFARQTDAQQAATNFALTEPGAPYHVHPRGYTVYAEPGEVPEEPEEPEPPETGYEWPPGATPVPSAVALTVVPTFENAGLTWPEPTGSGNADGWTGPETNECLVRFRRAAQGPLTAGPWRQGLSLWWDRRTVNPDRKAEYRGSLFGLEPDTQYDVEVLTASSRRTAKTTFRTWSDSFKIAKTITVQNRNSTLNITEGGSEGAGYVVYEPSPGGGVIDLNNGGSSFVTINAPYVIVRGLTCRRGRAQNGVGLGSNCHHVILDQLDISAFGRPDPQQPQFGLNDRGIGMISAGAVNANIRRIVIQRCKIHDPNYDTNSWEEERPHHDDRWHPVGATPIHLVHPAGEIVIRHNEIWSTMDRMFNDGIGGGPNFGHGNVSRDSDIYGNAISHCWDDAIEVEGYNANCRIYGNKTERAMVSVAIAATIMGPVYVMRNVATRGIRNPAELTDSGTFIKMRSQPKAGPPERVTNGGGRVLLYHNTCYHISVSDRVATPINHGGVMGVLNVVARNNIWDTRNSITGALTPLVYSDFDSDLFKAQHAYSWALEQPDGIVGAPIYEPGHASGPYTLAANSPGRNAGKRIPNVNDAYEGGAPDLGAQERGQPPLRFGVTSSGLVG